MKNIIHVAVGAIVNDNDEVLISQRLEGTHLAGMWEFPGGKLEINETVTQAMKRELREELGIELKSYRPLIRIRHDYPEKSVLLDVWKIDEYSGNPSGVEGQLVQWCAIDDLQQQQFPAADAPIIQALKLPAHYMITGKFTSVQDFEKRLLNAIDQGIQMLQLRLTKEWLMNVSNDVAREIMMLTQRHCASRNIKMLLNVPDKLNHELNSLSLHLNSRRLHEIDQRPDCELLSASCHNIDELKKAVEIGADFALLSPVQTTASHPDAVPLGWEDFKNMVDTINIPVYALGGVDKTHTETSWLAGAQGISGISAFWNT